MIVTRPDLDNMEFLATLAHGGRVYVEGEPVGLITPMAQGWEALSCTARATGMFNTRREAMAFLLRAAGYDVGGD